MTPLLLLVASSSGPTPIVAVFDVELSGVNLQRSARAGLDDYLFNKVAGSGAFRVVPKAELKKALHRQKLESYRECYDQSCQIEIGKELAAEKSISTKILKLGSECVVSVVLFDLAAAASERASDATGACTIGALVRSVETAVLAIAGPKQDAVASQQGVVDAKLCPLPGTRRVGDPPPEGQSYQCLDAKNRIHGVMVQFHPNGELLYRAEFREGKAEGPAVSYHANGKLSERGENRAGKREGKWERFGDNGVKFEEGIYRSGAKTGVWTQFHGTLGYKMYETRYEKDVKNGVELEFWQDGRKRAEGPYRSGQREGLWTFYSEDGSKHDATYANGVRSGLSRSYDPEGRVIRSYEYANDDENGTYRQWSMADGKQYLSEEGTFTDGERHGVFFIYAAGGKKREMTTFARGKRHGKHIFFDSNGRPREESIFENGREVSKRKL